MAKSELQKVIDLLEARVVEHQQAIAAIRTSIEVLREQQTLKAAKKGTTTP